MLFDNLFYFFDQKTKLFLLFILQTGRTSKRPFRRDPTRAEAKRLDRLEASLESFLQRQRRRPFLRPRLEASFDGRLASIAIHDSSEPTGKVLKIFFLVCLIRLPFFFVSNV